MSAEKERMAFSEKLKWWYFYHTRSQKGRFEVYHFAQWLLCIGLLIAAGEAAVYLWLNG